MGLAQARLNNHLCTIAYYFGDMRQRVTVVVTRCAYVQGRVKRLSPSIYINVCVCVCRQKTRLFAVLPLENRKEVVLYRSASQFTCFERCLQSRTSLLSSAMALGF